MIKVTALNWTHIVFTMSSALYTFVVSLIRKTCIISTSLLLPAWNRICFFIIDTDFYILFSYKCYKVINFRWNLFFFFQTSAPGCREADGVPDCAGEQQHVRVLSHSSHPLSDQRSGWSALAGLPGKHPHCFSTHPPAFPSSFSSSAFVCVVLFSFFMWRYCKFKAVWTFDSSYKWQFCIWTILPSWVSLSYSHRLCMFLCVFLPHRLPFSLSYTVLFHLSALSEPPFVQGFRYKRFAL